jgi:hypothetical protein
MGLIEAGAWGIAGGIAAGLVALSADVVGAKFRWPWGNNPDGIWPRVFVIAVGLVVGAIVAAAAHSQMTGPWPAFLLGVGAPAVVQAAITRVEVAEGKPSGEDHADTA